LLKASFALREIQLPVILWKLLLSVRKIIMFWSLVHSSGSSGHTQAESLWQNKFIMQEHTWFKKFLSHNIWPSILKQSLEKWSLAQCGSKRCAKGARKLWRFVSYWMVFSIRGIFCNTFKLFGNISNTQHQLQKMHSSVCFWNVVSNLLYANVF